VTETPLGCGSEGCRFRGMQVQRDAMDKVNFKKELAQLYNPTNTDWQLV
jgi:hypothetical protein